VLKNAGLARKSRTLHRIRPDDWREMQAGPDRAPYSAANVVNFAKPGGKMSPTAEDVIVRAIHTAFTKYPEGDGGPHLDYEWVQPEQSSHVAKAILLELAANGFEIVNKGG
jgi:hypothetical protein